MRDPALDSGFTESGIPATNAHASILSLSPPNGTASLRSSTRNTSTVSPGCSLIPTNCSYAVNESTAMVVSSAFAIFPRQGVDDIRRKRRQSAEAV